MSLYAKDPEPLGRVGLFENKNVCQIGFLVLAVSALLRVVERIVDCALHSDELQFTATDWAWTGLTCLVMVAFAVVFLRNFTKGYSQRLIRITLACTAAGGIAFIAWYLLAFVIHGASSTIIEVTDWLEIPGHTGAPLTCILGPFLHGSTAAYHFYLRYVVSADYVIRLSFLGFCVAKSRKTQLQAAEQVQTRIARGLGMSAGAR
jgi:hypothetical protein